jgi:hypothetical protein
MQSTRRLADCGRELRGNQEAANSPRRARRPPALCPAMAACLALFPLRHLPTFCAPSCTSVLRQCSGCQGAVPPRRPGRGVRSVCVGSLQDAAEDAFQRGVVIGVACSVAIVCADADAGVWRLADDVQSRCGEPWRFVGSSCEPSRHASTTAGRARAASGGASYTARPYPRPVPFSVVVSASPPLMR